MGSHHCVIHLFLHFSAKLETKVNQCSSQGTVRYTTDSHHAPRCPTWNFFRKFKQGCQQVLWKIKKNQQKKCMNKTGECIFLSASCGCMLTKGKKWNQQGWSQKGSRCVMSFKHWDSSFENKSFLLCIRERFRSVFVRHKCALISFFVAATFKQTCGRRT